MSGKQNAGDHLRAVKLNVAVTKWAYFANW
jgi:hypothetical protein